MRTRIVLTLAICSLVTLATAIVMSFHGVEWQTRQPIDQGVIEIKDGDLCSIGLQGGALFWKQREVRYLPLSAYLSMVTSPPAKPHWMVPTHHWQAGPASTKPSRNPLRVDGRAIWYIPIWIELALLSLLPSYILWRLYRTRNLLRRGHCVHCGYCVTGNTSGVCPECGTSVSSSA